MDPKGEPSGTMWSGNWIINGKVMTDIGFAWSDVENGWASGEVVLTGRCVVVVSLKGNGYVVVKKREVVGGDNPKVYVSRRLSELRLKVGGDAVGRRIQVLTSVEPNYIRYANI